MIKKLLQLGFKKTKAANQKDTYEADLNGNMKLSVWAKASKTGTRLSVFITNEDESAIYLDGIETTDQIQNIQKAFAK